jgi:Pentatricopeptide repeat domain
LLLFLLQNNNGVVSFTSTPVTSSSLLHNSRLGLWTPPLSTTTTRLSLSSAIRVPASSSTDDDEDSNDFEFDEEAMLVELEDLDDFDISQFIAKKQQWDKELMRLAQTAAQDPKAVAKAEAIVDKMSEAFVRADDSALWPQVDVYNLLLEIHAYSKAAEGAEKAEQILAQMEDETVKNIAGPTMESYLNVMDAWALRRKPNRAEGIVQRLEKYYLKTKDESLRPTADVYNKLIKAHGMSGDTDAARSILTQLLNQEGGIKANYKTWLQTMKAYAPQRGGAEKVQELLDQMQEAYLAGAEEFKPTTEAYNTLIRAMGQTFQGVADGEALLYKMLEQYRNGDEDMRPNANTFRNVIQSYKTRGDSTGAGVKAEQLLQLQERLYEMTKADDLKLDLRIFNTVLSTVARSKDSKKAKRALRLVEKMKKSEDPSLSPTVFTYYSLLSACAHTIGNADENLAAFQIAIATVNELRESKEYDSDSGCMGMFLRSCANLMPPSRKRDAVVEKMFQQCCAEGLLNDFVLKEFERAASEELQLQTLGGFLEDGVQLPDGWSSNVVVGRH